MLHIAYDREESSEMNARYFVFDEGNGIEGVGYPIIYKGTYAQCLVVVGAFSLSPETTLQEINEKCNGYLFE